MSRSVYLHCCDHKDSSDSQNRGEELLRLMWKTRAHVKALSDSGAWSDPVPQNGDFGDWFSWIATHHDCAVILRDEYGGLGPADHDQVLDRKADVDDVAAWTGRRSMRTLEDCGIFR